MGTIRRGAKQQPVVILLGSGIHREILGPQWQCSPLASKGLVIAGRSVITKPRNGTMPPTRAFTPKLGLQGCFVTSAEPSVLGSGGMSGASTGCWYSAHVIEQERSQSGRSLRTTRSVGRCQSGWAIPGTPVGKPQSVQRSQVTRPSESIDGQRCARCTSRHCSLAEYPYEQRGHDEWTLVRS